jgi:hypothetical protein
MTLPKPVIVPTDTVGAGVPGVSSFDEPPPHPTRAAQHIPTAKPLMHFWPATIELFSNIMYSLQLMFSAATVIDHAQLVGPSQ